MKEKVEKLFQERSQVVQASWFLQRLLGDKRWRFTLEQKAQIAEKLLKVAVAIDDSTEKLLGASKV